MRRRAHDRRRRPCRLLQRARQRRPRPSRLRTTRAERQMTFGLRHRPPDTRARAKGPPRSTRRLWRCCRHHLRPRRREPVVRNPSLGWHERRDTRQPGRVRPRLRHRSPALGLPTRLSPYGSLAAQDEQSYQVTHARFVPHGNPFYQRRSWLRLGTWSRPRQRSSFYCPRDQPEHKHKVAVKSRRSSLVKASDLTS
jgi:hypothetical protein